MKLYAPMKLGALTSELAFLPRVCAMSWCTVHGIRVVAQLLSKTPGRLMSLQQFLSTQDAALAWLYRHSHQAVIDGPPRGDIPFILPLDGNHSWERFERGTWILRTPAGPLLWARNGDRDYRSAFASFATQDLIGGWPTGQYHVDHLISRHAHRRRFPGNVADDLHVLALIPSGHNRAWAAWEKRNRRHNNVLDLWVTAKVTGVQPPYKQDGVEAWLDTIELIAPDLVSRLSVGSLPARVAFPRDRLSRLAEAMLSVEVAAGLTPVENVAFMLLTDLLETMLFNGEQRWTFDDQPAARKLAGELIRLGNRAADHRGRLRPTLSWQPFASPDAAADGGPGFEVDCIYVMHADIS
jgi:hypothetical protein